MKRVLDVTCGGRMMWFDKEDCNTVFVDKRIESHTLCDKRPFVVRPDIQADFSCLPFRSNTFNLVVFDPPHLKKIGSDAWMCKKYGQLLPSWQTDLKSGFDECMRVLVSGGTLVFKWNEAQIKTSEVIGLFGQQPLFGHPTAKHGKTKWMTYLKN